jgi:acyl-CoA thioesterase II
MPDVPPAEVLEQESWSPTFERAYVPADRISDSRRDGRDGRDGMGRAVAWMRVTEDIGDPNDPANQLLHRCWLAFLSDDLPTDAVHRAHPMSAEADYDASTNAADQADAGRSMFAASLDHTVWFHRPITADQWHLHDFSCVHFVGGRGLAIGHIFALDGLHVATVAQEVLMRDTRNRE